MRRIKRSFAAFMIAIMAVVAVAGTSMPVEAAKKAPKKIYLKATSKTVDIKGKVKVSVKSVKPKKASTAVKFKSSNKKIATVSKKGVVTGKKKGTVKITVISKKNKKVKKTIKIKVKNLKPKKISISKTLTLDKGKYKTLKATLKPVGLKNKGLTWKSSDKSVATVNSKGKVTAKKAGKATITVTTKEKNSKGKKLSAKCVVTVKDTSKDNPSKDDPSKDDPSKDDPSKDDPSKDDPSKDDPSKDDPSKDDPSKDDPSKDDPSKDDPTLEEQKNIEMSREDLKYIITGMQKGYTILDVRKASDYETSHIIGAISADVDGAKTGEDIEASKKNIQAAIKEKDASEKYVLICYSGASYAAAARSLLVGEGIDNNNIYTLKGGQKGWTETDTYGHYQRLIDLAKENSAFAASLFLPDRNGDYYITPQETLEMFKKDEISKYYIMDARPAANYEQGHVLTSVLTPTFASISGPQFVSREQAIKNVQDAFAKYPYIEGRPILIVCQGGRGGAQLLDDVLVEEFGIDNSLVYTMSYGYTAFDESWTKLDGHDEYTVTGAEPGTLSPNYKTPEELKTIIESEETGYTILDVRKASDYAIEHINNSISADVDDAKSGKDEAPSIANLQTAIKGKDANQKYVVICYGGVSYAAAATRLLIGLGVNNNRIFTLQGGMTAWKKMDGFSKYTSQFMTADAVKGVVDKEDAEYVILDVRKLADYNTAHIKGAISADVDGAKTGDNIEASKKNIQEALGKVSDASNKKFILICYGGKLYAQAGTRLLVDEGIKYDNIYTMTGGMGAWTYETVQ